MALAVARVGRERNAGDTHHESRPRADAVGEGAPQLAAEALAHELGVRPEPPLVKRADVDGDRGEARSRRDAAVLRWRYSRNRTRDEAREKRAAGKDGHR